MEEMRFTIERYQQREQDLNNLLSRERDNNINAQVIPEKFVAKMNVRIFKLRESTPVIIM